MPQRLFQGRTNNHLNWVMVDATDFATPESAMSAATKIKVYGQLQGATGTNFVSSGTGSLTNDITHVGASVLGTYQIALAKADLSDASAAWYDNYVVALSATGAAYQIIVCEGVLAGGIVSGVSAICSDIYSALILTQSMASDAASAAQQANSRVLLNQSRISDTYSMLVVMSDIVSNINSMLVAGVFISASDMSDLRSAITAGHALSASDMSDLRSAITAGGAISASDMSDLRSAITAGHALSASDMSDLRSAITAGAAGTVTASDISDIASAVADVLASRLSDILSAAVQTNSRALVIQSSASDIYSLLSDVSSDLGVMSGILSDTLSSIQSTGIRKNAAFSNFEFLMVDSTDHVTPKTGLTVAGTASIDGAAFAAVAGTFAEVANGIYQFDALAADTNGDVITWKFTGAAADTTYFTFKTIP